MINANINSPVKFWKAGGYGFDTAGLKFLFDPARMLGMNAGLSLGDNLVTNGDFHDFTMENDANVKGHWIFDSYYDGLEGGEGIENDWSGNDNDLTPNNFETDFEGSLTGSNPVYENGNALELNGIDQSLSLAGVSAGDLDATTGSFTIETWMRVESEEDVLLVGKRQGGTYAGYLFLADSSNIMKIGLRDDVANSLWISCSGGNFRDGNWHYLAVVVDRGADEVKMYLDGVQYGITQDISALTGTLTNSRDFEIGKSWSKWHTGHIAEVRYSDVVRTYAEIQRSYGAGKGWTPDEAETDTLYLNSSWKAGIQQVSGADSFSQALTLENGELYRIEITAHTEVGGNNARLVFDYGSANMDTGNFDPGDTATKFVYYQRTNGTACGISLYGGNAAQMNFYEDVKVQKVQNVMDYGFENRGFVEDFSLGGNLLTDITDYTSENFSYEDGIGDWVVEGANTIDFVSTKAKFGTKSLEITYVDSGRGAHLYLRDANGLTENLVIGKWYKVSGWIATNGAGDGVGLKVERPDVGNLDLTGIVNTETLTYFEGYFNASSEIGCYLFCHDLEADEKLYIDGLKIEKVDNGFHGVTANSLEDDQPVHPSGISFDGVADYMDFGDNINPTSNDFIAFGWAKLTKTANFGVIFGRDAVTGNVDAWGMYMTPDGYLSAQTRTYTAGQKLRNVVHLVDFSGDWHFVVHVHDQDGYDYLFIDNIQRDSNDNLLDTMGTIDVNLRIGLAGTPQNDFANGLIGMCGMYLFDGADGAPAALPATYATLISNIYNWGLNNRFGYGTDK